MGAIITNEVNQGKKTNSSIGYELSNDTRLYRPDSKNGLLLKVRQKLSGLGGDKTGLTTTFLAMAEREAFKEEVKFTAAVEAEFYHTRGASRVTDRFFLEHEGCEI